MDEEDFKKKKPRRRRGTAAERNAVDSLPIWPELASPLSPYADGKTPRVKGSKTSGDAAESLREDIPTLREQVYARLAKVKEYGATDDELERHLKVIHQTVSARRRELVLLEHVVDSGRVRKTRSGRNAVVWVLAKYGGAQ